METSPVYDLPFMLSSVPSPCPFDLYALPEPPSPSPADSLPTSASASASGSTSETSFQHQHQAANHTCRCDASTTRVAAGQVVEGVTEENERNEGATASIVQDDLPPPYASHDHTPYYNGHPLAYHNLYMHPCSYLPYPPYHHLHHHHQAMHSGDAPLRAHPHPHRHGSHVNTQSHHPCHRPHQAYHQAYHPSLYGCSHSPAPVYQQGQQQQLHHQQLPMQSYTSAFAFPDPSYHSSSYCHHPPQPVPHDYPRDLQQAPPSFSYYYGAGPLSATLTPALPATLDSCLSDDVHNLCSTDYNCDDMEEEDEDSLNFEQDHQSISDINTITRKNSRKHRSSSSFSENARNMRFNLSIAFGRFKSSLRTAFSSLRSSSSSSSSSSSFSSSSSRRRGLFRYSQEQQEDEGGIYGCDQPGCECEDFYDPLYHYDDYEGDLEYSNQCMGCYPPPPPPSGPHLISLDDEYPFENVHLHQEDYNLFHQLSLPISLSDRITELEGAGENSNSSGEEDIAIELSTPSRHHHQHFQRCECNNCLSKLARRITARSRGGRRKYRRVISRNRRVAGFKISRLGPTVRTVSAPLSPLSPSSGFPW